MDWKFTGHALRRAVEMAVDADEIQDALVRPQKVYPTSGNRQVRQADRIALVTEGNAVITCLWKADPGERWDRNDISMCRDAS